MKLLLDENLSHRLASALQADFPGSTHVGDVGLQRADDAKIWSFAREHDFTIVSKDSDFRQLSFLYGQPPKVIWLRLGNCTTGQILAALQRHVHDVLEFEHDKEATFMIIVEVTAGCASAAGGGKTGLGMTEQ